jgi:hypothetical protein
MNFRYVVLPCIKAAVAAGTAVAFVTPPPESDCDPAAVVCSQVDQIVYFAERAPERHVDLQEYSVDSRLVGLQANTSPQSSVDYALEIKQTHFVLGTPPKT